MQSRPSEGAAGTERSGPASTVRVATDSGRIRILAEDREEVDVHGPATVTSEGGLVTITGRSEDVDVRVPAGVDLIVGSTSGRVTVEGDTGHVAIVTTSGRISVEAATSLDARSESGRIEVARVGGECCIRSGSARVDVGACLGTDISTTSGRISVGSADGPVRAHCVSGRISVEMAHRHAVSAETVSGRIDLTVPAGASGGELVSAATGSGRVVVRER